MTPAATRPTAISAARTTAYAVIRRVFEQGAYADRALHAEARNLGPRDRALSTALAYGTIQRRRTLDHVAARLSSRPPDRLDAPVIAALRLGLQQVLFMEGIAEHAAVHESVELAKRHARAGSGLVNAVLRRAITEGPGIVRALDDTTPQHAAVRHSVPDWLAELWWSELGPDRTRSLLRAVNQPAESALRVNALVTIPEAVRAQLPGGGHADPGLPEAVVLDAPFDVYASELWRAGAVMPQSRASMTVARTLAPQPGDRVLDLCAAPGGKTTHLAALMGDTGELVAVEQHAGRAQALQETLTRMHVTCGRVQVADAAALPATLGAFDRVLVDPPCSGLGTLQSRPDLRWRASPDRIATLAGLQTRILAAGAAATRPGGTLVYSVCTISAAESDAVIEAFLGSHPGWAADPPRRLAPDADGTDGFFIARLRRPVGR